MSLDELKSYKFPYYNSRYIHKNYPELYQFLESRYNDTDSFAEKIWLWQHNLDTRPTCKICGKKTKFIDQQRGYSPYCSKTCAHKSRDRIKNIQQTTLERYGVKSPLQSKKIQTNTKKTCIKKYGVDNPKKLEAFKEKAKQTSIAKYGMPYYSQTDECKNKTKTTNLNKYGVTNHSQTDEYKTHMKKLQPIIRKKVKETSILRYGVDNYTKSKHHKEYMKTEEYKQKSYNTRKKNNSFNTSKIEKDFKNWLDENHINYKYQYRSDSYPFNCDFYFPDKDLYLEIQGSWVHGPHPFNESSQEDQELLSLWKSKQTKFYNNAITAWTVRDPMKRSWAKEHNLNWTEVFTIDVQHLIDTIKDII